MFPFHLLSALKNLSGRRSGLIPKPAVQARRTRVALDLEPLEDRCLLSAGAAVTNDPPAPVGATSGFAVGFGPGMQLDIFETDQAGQVFAQSVMNLFGEHGPTTFINSKVAITSAMPTPLGPVVSLSGPNNQPLPAIVTDPSDPYVSGPLMSALPGSLGTLLTPFIPGGPGNTPGSPPSSPSPGTPSSPVAGTYATVDHPAAATDGNEQPQHVTIRLNSNGTSATVSIPDFPAGAFQDTLSITTTANGDGTFSVNGADAVVTQFSFTINGNQMTGVLDVQQNGLGESFAGHEPPGGVGPEIPFTLTKQ